MDRLPLNNCSCFYDSDDDICSEWKLAIANADVPDDFAKPTPLLLIINKNIYQAP